MPLGLGSRDMPLAPAPGTARPAPVDELRLGWVQGLEEPIERLDSIAFYKIRQNEKY